MVCAHKILKIYEGSLFDKLNQHTLFVLSSSSKVLGKDLCGIYDAVVHMATSFDEHAPELTQFLLRVVKEHCQAPVILAIGAATVEHKTSGILWGLT
jgi:hypothetical protein